MAPLQTFFTVQFIWVIIHTRFILMILMLLLSILFFQQIWIKLSSDSGEESSILCVTALSLSFFYTHTHTHYFNATCLGGSNQLIWTANHFQLFRPKIGITQHPSSIHQSAIWDEPFINLQALENGFGSWFWNKIQYMWSDIFNTCDQTYFSSSSIIFL